MNSSIGRFPLCLYLLLTTATVVVVNVNALLLVPATRSGRGGGEHRPLYCSSRAGVRTRPPSISWSVLRAEGATRSSSSSSSSTAIDELSKSETKVYQLLQDLHDAQFPFRLVVIGNGAILETTSMLGPTFKVGKSPKTGENLTTFASSDQSFEFHLKLAQVKRIVLTSRTSLPGGGEGPVMQLFRFLTADGTPMCSLIVADQSEAAKVWFQSMVEKYDGGDIQL
jgi:hypothetical protein